MLAIAKQRTEVVHSEYSQLAFVCISLGRGRVEKVVSEYGGGICQCVAKQRKSTC